MLWFSRGVCIITGAIFTEDQKDSSAELAFKYAVYRINKDKNLLPNTTLVYDIQYVPRDDSFRTSKKGKLTISTTHQLPWNFVHLVCSNAVSCLSICDQSGCEYSHQERSRCTYECFGGGTVLLNKLLVYSLAFYIFMVHNTFWIEKSDKHHPCLALNLAYFRG